LMLIVMSTTFVEKM